MSAYVLDTSTALAWYLPEEFAAAARQWQQEMIAGRFRFVVPSLHYWEFANVLRTYVLRQELEAEAAQSIYALHLELPLTIREPDRQAILGVALEYRATVYDAVYIALSLALDAPLLTAERTTTPWVVKLGDRVRCVSGGVTSKNK